jgi:hypothetical protein
VSTAALAARLSRFAASTLSGRRIVQPQAVKEEKAEVQPDVIAEARQTVESFAKRMMDLHETRKAFDAATDAARKSGDLDLASILAVDPGADLPDIEEISGNATKAGVRLRALRTLADREVESAARALLVLRKTSADNVARAKAAALEKTRDMIPPGIFSPDVVEEIIEKALSVRECSKAARDLERLASAGIPTVKAELFGRRLPFFRLDPLPPAKSGHVPPRDALDPLRVAASIRTVLAIHAATIGFLLAITTDAASARWKD